MIQKVSSFSLYLSNKLVGYELHHPNILKTSILSTNSSHTAHECSPHKCLLSTEVKTEVFIKIERFNLSELPGYRALQSRYTPVFSHT